MTVHTSQITVVSYWFGFLRWNNYSNASLVWTAMLFVGQNSDVPHTVAIFILRIPMVSRGYVATHACIVVHAFVFMFNYVFFEYLYAYLFIHIYLHMTISFSD